MALNPLDTPRGIVTLLDRPLVLQARLGADYRRHGRYRVARLPADRKAVTRVTTGEQPEALTYPGWRVAWHWLPIERAA